MELIIIFLACCFVYSCNGQLYSGFQSPFPSKLFPPSTFQVQRTPHKFEAVQRQPSFAPCSHATFPTFDSPFNKYPWGNPCPSIDPEYSFLQGPPPAQKAASSKNALIRIMNPSESTTMTTVQPTEMTTKQPIETTDKQPTLETTEEPIAMPNPTAVHRDYSKIFESKCKEYTEWTIERTFFGSMQLIPTFTEVETSTCDMSRGLITGGIKVQNPREFPHMAGIGYKDNRGAVAFGCGGSLISDRFVLTAAHCELRNDIDPASLVRLDSLKLKVEDGGHLAVEAFISHERYDFVSKQNDIALIKLEKRVKFAAPFYVRPACLWQDEDLPVDKAIATGFGASQHGGEMSADLMKVRLDILDNDVCAKYFVEDDDEDYREGSVVINSNQLCIGSYESGKDTCQGDSGGPVQIAFANHTCVSHIIGVTSFGSTVCGGENTPAVYTRVSAYIDWIGSKVYG